jgi:hypothetical protein
MNPVKVVDSHTGGEPTRVVIAGGPDLGRGPMADRLAAFKSKHDAFRSAVVNEPRGSDVVVGALLCGPVDPASAAGVIFFNNVGVLGMCGHGTIGLVATLAHLGRLRPGAHRIETPVGVVTATLHASGEVSVANVPSRRARKGVAVDVDGHRLGRQLVFPRRAARTEPRGAKRRRARRLRGADPPRARAAGHHGREGRGDRPHRAFRAVEDAGEPQPQLHALSGRSLGPFALRDRHEREAGLPRRRREAEGRRGLAPGKHRGQRFRGVGEDRRRRRPSDDQGLGIHYLGSDAVVPSGGSIRIGHREISTRDQGPGTREEGPALQRGQER